MISLCLYIFFVYPHIKIYIVITIKEKNEFIPTKLARKNYEKYTSTETFRSLWGLLNFLTLFFTILLESKGTAIVST